MALSHVYLLAVNVQGQQCCSEQTGTASNGKVCALPNQHTVVADKREHAVLAEGSMARLSCAAERSMLPWFWACQFDSLTKILICKQKQSNTCLMFADQRHTQIAALFSATERRVSRCILVAEAVF